VNPSRASWPDRFSLAHSAILFAVAVGFGLLSEHVNIGLDNPRRWVPDLLVGVALTGFGSFAWRLQRGTGSLLFAAGVAWWLGDLSSPFLYIHRGLLLHAVATYPSWRTSRAGAGLLALGYAFACWYSLASTNLGTALFGIVVTGVALARLFRAGGRTPKLRMAMVYAATALFVGTVGAVVIRITASRDVLEPASLLYQVGLAAAAGMLSLGLRAPTSTSIANIVVDLGESRSGARDALARVLDDPLLEIGFRTDDGSYVDASGDHIDLPAEGSSRVATLVDQGTGRQAVIIHDRTLLADTTLLEAVSEVATLSASNAELNARARHQLTELTEARRRILTSEDQERRRLSNWLYDETEPGLASVEELLVFAVEALESYPGIVTPVGDALDQLRRARDDLHTITQGLHPWESSGDLRTAMLALAEHSPVPVTITIPDISIRDEVASAIYYVCSEGVANALKHAAALHIEVALMRDYDRVTLTVSDDGRGGADADGGSGLRGLVDRVAGLGGVLQVESPRGQGTLLTASFPVDGES